MPMTLGDASDIQKLIHYAYGLGNTPGEFPAPAPVEEAAKRLAERSHNVLGAGLSARDLDGRQLLP